MPELYLDGVWASASAGGRRAIHCPAEGPWPHWSARERGDLLLRTADLLERDAEAVALAESRDTGKRLVEGRYDVADVVSVLRYYGHVAAEDAGRVVDTGNPDVVSRIVHEPVGVCGLIAPWNYPLLQASWKVAPCLAAGNTFILKPSELTPSTSIHLMRIFEEAGLPKGVGNLVLGAGPDAGAPLAVEDSIHDAFVDALVERAQLIRLGGPFDEKAETGALISAAHREKVAAYVAAGLAEGAVLRCGGKAPDDPALADGFYY